MVYEDIFKVVGKNKNCIPAKVEDESGKARTIYNDGKKWERVDRLTLIGETYKAEVVVDVHTDLFPVNEGDTLSIALATTLNLDGSPDKGHYDQSTERSLLDNYDYGMFGTLFKIDGPTQLDNDFRRTKAPSGPGNAGMKAYYFSFGGLLMRVESEQRHLVRLAESAKYYFLARKAQ